MLVGPKQGIQRGTPSDAECVYKIFGDKNTDVRGILAHLGGIEYLIEYLVPVSYTHLTLPTIYSV